MGAVLSHMSIVRAAIKHLLSLTRDYEELKERIETTPGLPIQGPTESFWLDIPSSIGSKPRARDGLPKQADVVIIGSGITGASVARTLLRQSDNGSLKIVMLEARDVCSGATGRNGGHLKPPLHHDYAKLKQKYGIEQARMVMRFRLAHISEVRKVAVEEDILAKCQYQPVEGLDVYYDPEAWEEAKELLEIYRTDLPEESSDFLVVEKDKAVQNYRLSADTIGLISNQVASVHPYKFVTSLLEKFLKEYPENFSIWPRTPCTQVLPPSSSSRYYTVVTPKGSISTPHVVHASNAWVSHLVEPMRTKVIPMRGHMSAQRPGRNLTPSTLDGKRSWVFYDDYGGFDYLTQQPVGEHEMMFGGGFFRSGDNGFEDIGNTDDSGINQDVASHIAGALPVVFGEKNWGAEASPGKPAEGGKKWNDGRVKALWTGIMSFSADVLPWVGRLPPKVSGRPAPTSDVAPRFVMAGSRSEKLIQRKTAPPGEWIAAGYSGEGMVHAFLSGRATAFMILNMETEGRVKEWLPDIMRVTEKRWKKVKVEHLIEEITN